MREGGRERKSWDRELRKEADDERVAVRFAVASFDGGEDHEGDPSDGEDGKQEEEKETDEDKSEDASHDPDEEAVEGVAELEIDDFLAEGIKGGRVFFF